MTYRGLYLELRKPEKEDIDLMVQWAGEPVFMTNLYGSPFENVSSRYQHAHSLLSENAKDFSTTKTLISRDLVSGQSMGLLMFNHIHWKHRHVEMNTFLGDVACRSGMHGFELYLLGLIYCFFELNMHKVFGYTYNSNTAALKLNRFGGKVTGTLRQHHYREGNYVDVVTHSILKREFLVFVERERDKLLSRYARKGIWREFGV